MGFAKKLILAMLILFAVPTTLSIFWWLSVERPASWHEARWDATGLLPSATASDEAAVYILAARTGGLKGALSMHTWIVTKAVNAVTYNRYDKVGWGSPIRVNAYSADARWYSNRPRIVKAYFGAQAQRLILKIDAAIARYPHARRGDYRIWPGPNSNSFVAYVLREVGELNAVLPSLAIGRNYLANGQLVHVAADWQEVSVSLQGLIGVSIGARSGIEVQLLGLVAGLDIREPGIKLPGLGRIGI